MALLDENPTKERETAAREEREAAADREIGAELVVLGRVGRYY